MLIPIGIFASSGARAAGAFDLLESTVLTGSQNAIEFTNLATKYAATYQHFQLRVTARSTSGNSQINGLLRLNGDSGSNYAFHFLFADGADVYSAGAGSQSSIELGAFVTAARSSNIFSAGVIDILDPFETTKNKTIRTLMGSTEFNRIFLSSGLWMNTAEVTTLRFVGSAGDWAQGTRISLYGIKATA
jgi:hypothetical protein